MCRLLYFGTKLFVCPCFIGLIYFTYRSPWFLTSLDGEALLLVVPLAGAFFGVFFGVSTSVFFNILLEGVPDWENTFFLIFCGDQITDASMETVIKKKHNHR